jgi:hypothetical protein
MSYQGSCHCGAVQYRVEGTIAKAMECNCSICSRKGHLLAFVGEGQFELLKGQEDLSDYQFGKKHIHHLFCKQCGVGTFGRGANPDGSQMYAVNVRCLDGLDFKALPVDQYDGKSI